MPACPLARTVTPSHQHLCFPLYRPSHLRSLDAARPPFFLVVCCGLSSPPARIYPLPYYPPALPLCAREKEWRKTTVAWDGKSRRPSLHTANPPFFHGNHRLHRARSESPSAHGTRGECDWIKLELQRMIGQSFTRLRPFFFFLLGTLVGTPAEIPAADVGMTNITARWCISNVAHSFPEV